MVVRLANLINFYLLSIKIDKAKDIDNSMSFLFISVVKFIVYLFDNQINKYAAGHPAA